MTATNCPHLALSVGFMNLPDLNRLLANPECETCHAGPDSELWLCLYPDCYMLGCSEDPDHSSIHNNSYPMHALQLNIKSKRIWCYKCNTEVLIQSDVEKQFGALIPPPKSGVQVAEAPPESRKHSNMHDGTPWGLVGLSNLGNTCYMNAALQCLQNIPALTEFFVENSTLIRANPESTHPMSRAFLVLTEQLWRKRSCQGSFIAPMEVLKALKNAYPMFRGFLQHDSQEFLRCLMDLIHKELMEPTMHSNLEEDIKESDTEESENENMDVEELSVSEEEEENYETAEDSGMSEQSSISSEELNNDEPVSRKKPGEDMPNSFVAISQNYQDDEEKEKDTVSSGIGSMDTRQSSLRSVKSVPYGSGGPGSDSEPDFMDASSTTSRGSLSSPGPLSTLNSNQVWRKNPSSPKLQKRKHPLMQRSIISDTFDGKLVSSVQCLTCNRVSRTTEVFQDLSLPIPTSESLAAINGNRSAVSSTYDQSWKSWFFSWFTGLSGWLYGPDISLQDCLNYFFSADELKGDNMYSCERCKKLRNGLKYSRVTILPEILCIHLKRFRHDFLSSSKISSRVSFPLTDLDLTPWMHKESKSRVCLFDLSGIICHRGCAGGGHYIAYALNPMNNEWYQFDDTVVTKVDAAQVLNEEAYVLFYRKNNLGMEAIRLEMQDLLLKEKESPSLMKFYVSRQWLNKLENFGEPGPIDNSDFLCIHGGVLPEKVEHVYSLCVELPQSAWDFLHRTFGGGPACTRLFECALCRQELDALTRQKLFELEEFKTLHKEFQNSNVTSIHCLNSSWFRLWEAFVTDRQRYPPGPINNMPIVTSTKSGQTNSTGSSSNLTLRTTSDYLQISQDTWRFFHSIYGGGPEVVIKPNGQILVSNPQSSSNRLRTERDSRTSLNMITRSKAKSICEDKTDPPVTRQRARYMSEGGSS